MGPLAGGRCRGLRPGPLGGACRKSGLQATASRSAGRLQSKRRPCESRHAPIANSAVVTATASPANRRCPCVRPRVSASSRAVALLSCRPPGLRQHAAQPDGCSSSARGAARSRGATSHMGQRRPRAIQRLVQRHSSGAIGAGIGGLPATAPAPCRLASSNAPSPVLSVAWVAVWSSDATASRTSRANEPVSSRSSRSRRARPKSMTRTEPSLPTITFCGLKSRCTIPAACAAASPRPVATKTSKISCQLRAVARRHSSSVSPSTNSMAM